MTDETLFRGKPARIGMTELGEMWFQSTCDGCGAERVALQLELYEDYDSGPRYVDLCAQCLRDLAGEMSEFERRHTEAGTE